MLFLPLVLFKLSTSYFCLLFNYYILTKCDKMNVWGICFDFLSRELITSFVDTACEELNWGFFRIFIRKRLLFI